MPCVFDAVEALDGKDQPFFESDASTRATSRNASTDSGSSRECVQRGKDLPIKIEDAVPWFHGKQKKKRCPFHECSIEDSPVLQRKSEDDSEVLKFLPRACQFDTLSSCDPNSSYSHTSASSCSSFATTSEVVGDEPSEPTLNPWERKWKFELPALGGSAGISSAVDLCGCGGPRPVRQDIRNRLVPLPLHQKRHSAPPIVNPARVSAMVKRVQKPPRVDKSVSENSRFILLAQGLPQLRSHSLPPLQKDERRGNRPSSQPVISPAGKGTCRSERKSPLVLAGRLVV